MSDSEEEEILESRGNDVIEQEISAGKLGTASLAQADQDDFISAASQMLWNRAPLASGKTRCPCFQRHTLVRCSNPVQDALGVKTVTAYEGADFEVQTCGIHKEFPEKAGSNGYQIWWEGHVIEDSDFSAAESSSDETNSVKSSEDALMNEIPGLLDFDDSSNSIFNCEVATILMLQDIRCHQWADCKSPEMKIVENFLPVNLQTLIEGPNSDGLWMRKVW